MELIDKSAIVAEIKRRISNHNKELNHASDEDFVSSWASDEENQKLALTALIPFINTLEVKEVDSEKEKLTWEDIREIYIIFAEIDAEIEFCKTDIQGETIGYYQDALKRYKAQKGE